MDDILIAPVQMRQIKCCFYEASIADRIQKQALKTSSLSGDSSLGLGQQFGSIRLSLQPKLILQTLVTLEPVTWINSAFSSAPSEYLCGTCNFFINTRRHIRKLHVSTSRVKFGCRRNLQHLLSCLAQGKGFRRQLG